MGKKGKVLANISGFPGKFAILCHTLEIGWLIVK